MCEHEEKHILKPYYHVSLFSYRVCNQNNCPRKMKMFIDRPEICRISVTQ